MPTTDPVAFAHARPNMVLLVPDLSVVDTGAVQFETLCVTELSPTTTETQVVLAIEKQDANPWAARISVGRTRNCDVVLRHPSVSKLHAHFVETAGTMALMDADSTNGTYINGKRIPTNQRIVLSEGDEIDFGQVRTEFHSPSSLFRLIAFLQGRDQLCG